MAIRFGFFQFHALVTHAARTLQNKLQNPINAVIKSVVVVSGAGDAQAVRLRAGKPLTPRISMPSAHALTSAMSAQSRGRPNNIKK
ncbi:hypothetical protein RCH09_003408 [Actimicrobium sp. GrIS 1.19]|uniref:hypothetical protein n=1 Tax=Actimicrobium sp. GrIS 1.19 TaxID=3071708 RepID=UPI002E010D51|nr:hypothetical protein [Actimicrobium sp. GrIS 1.19]